MDGRHGGDNGASLADEDQRDIWPVHSGHTGTSHPDTVPSITPSVVTPAPVSGYLLVACIDNRYIDI